MEGKWRIGKDVQYEYFISPCLQGSKQTKEINHLQLVTRAANLFLNIISSIHLTTDGCRPGKNSDFEITVVQNRIQSS